jgi:hypothetical protein
LYVLFPGTSALKAEQLKFRLDECRLDIKMLEDYSKINHKAFDLLCTEFDKRSNLKTDESGGKSQSALLPLQVYGCGT